MKSLEKWQIISFLSRGVSVGLGIIQSFIILRILSVGEWGLIQLSVSIGAALGIYQHLGLASAVSREIAATDKHTDVFKIFITSATVRYIVTIPLSLGLFLAAPRIASTYGFQEILIPLKIFSIILLLQGIQALLNSVISGTKRFKALFILQGVIALLSILIYVPFVYKYKIIGFFYANLIHEVIKSILLIVIAFKPYLKSINMPTKKEFIAIFRDLFSLGMAIYIVKIIVVNWEKAGINLLGLTGKAEIIGIFSFALLYAKKLTHISDAVTDVNLPVFSEKYVKDIDDFKKVFESNFNRIFVLIVFSAMSAIYFAKELIFVFIGSNKYDSALPLLVPMVFAFIFYSMINIIESSIAIPAKLVKDIILGFLLMLGVTVGVYGLGKAYGSPSFIMSYSMLAGTAVCFLYLVFILQKKLKFKFFNHSHVLIFIQSLVISYSNYIENIWIKIISYILFCLLFAWAVFTSEFLKKDQIKFLMDKSFAKLKITKNEKI